MDDAFHQIDLSGTVTGWGISMYGGLQACARVRRGVRNIVGGDGEGRFPGRATARKTAGEDCYSPSGKDMLKTSVEKALAPPGA